MADKPCAGDHAIHICELSQQGKHVEIKEAIKYPRFMCLNCGRVAGSGNNLCNPQAIDDIRPSGT